MTNTNEADWVNNWSKEWKRLDVVAWAHGKELKPRLKILEDRAEKLSDAALRYERETEETDATDARLNRMIGVSDRASAAADRLEERIEIAAKIESLYEDYTILAERKHRALRAR